MSRFTYEPVFDSTDIGVWVKEEGGAARVGVIERTYGEWIWSAGMEYRMTSTELREIAVKVDELNNVCSCKEWDNASERGTDHEGYGPAITGNTDGFYVGCDVPPIRFCPWCGKQTRKAII